MAKTKKTPKIRQKETATAPRKKRQEQGGLKQCLIWIVFQRLVTYKASN